MKDIKHIISFSGGKDSTAMLLMMIEDGWQIDKIVCVDTTKEFPQMYEHIKKVQEYIKPLEIEIISFDFDYYLSDYIKTKGKHKGKKGYGFPDFRNRWCTAQKSAAVKRIARAFKGEIIQYHGIAVDEPKRLEKNKGRNIRYPLAEMNITEAQALQYCYDKGFDWGGLYKKFTRVSCWCCPMSRIGELRILYNEFPNLWKELEEMDRKSYREFRPDYTVDELTVRFTEEREKLEELK